MRISDWSSDVCSSDLTVDCDVIQADGGTRTASISGAWVALKLAIEKLKADGAVFERDPLTTQVAAISCGIHEGAPVLDLDYVEDSAAHTDGNFVLTGNGGIVEVQATAEGAPFSERSEEHTSELRALMRS